MKFQPHCMLCGALANLYPPDVNGNVFMDCRKCLGAYQFKSVPPGCLYPVKEERLTNIVTGQSLNEIRDRLVTDFPDIYERRSGGREITGIAITQLEHPRCLIAIHEERK